MKKRRNFESVIEVPLFNKLLQQKKNKKSRIKFSMSNRSEVISFLREKLLERMKDQQNANSA